MPEVSAAVVLVAGGSGSRLGEPEKKQFKALAGVPLLLRALRAVTRHPAVRHAVVVLPRDDLERGRSLLHGARSAVGLSVVEGGSTRQESVRNGLAALPPAQVVLIHDAARPLVSARVVELALEAALGGHGAIPVLPVSDTLKRSGAEGLTTLPRDELYATQTPQAFPREMIVEAHRRAVVDGVNATDDAALCERYGFPVRAFPGEPGNLKITTPADWRLAEALLHASAAQARVRTGIGYDIHRLEAGRPCILGGVRIDSSKGPAGHSDADVLVHAIMDAVLGAAGEPDIGHRFSPDDVRYAGADSIGLLREIREVVESRFEVLFVDAVIVAEAPYLAPHVPEMRRKIAEALTIQPEHVNVKATTAEGLGALGRGEGIAAQAIATLRERPGP